MSSVSPPNPSVPTSVATANISQAQEDTKQRMDFLQDAVSKLITIVDQLPQKMVSLIDLKIAQSQSTFAENKTSASTHQADVGSHSESHVDDVVEANTSQQVTNSSGAESSVPLKHPSEGSPSRPPHHLPTVVKQPFGNTTQFGGPQHHSMIEGVSTAALSSMSISKQGPKAPIDINQSLPTLTTILVYTATPDMFVIWRQSLFGNVSSLRKFNGILDKPLAQSWALFKQNNAPKYTAEDLEGPYLAAHQELWSYINGGVDAELQQGEGEQMRSSKERSTIHIPSILGFTQGEEEFFMNAYEYIQRLERYFMFRSGVRIAEIIEKRDALHYSGREDPQIFITKFRHLLLTEKNLVADAPEYSDVYKARWLLAKLPPALSEVKSHFYHMERHGQTFTFESVQTALSQWWLMNKDRRARPGPPHAKRDGSYPKEKPSPQSAAVGATIGETKDGPQRKPTHKSKKSVQQHERPSSREHTPTKGSKAEEDKSRYDFSNVTIEATVESTESLNATTNPKATPFSFIPGPNDGLYDTATTTHATGRTDLLQNVRVTPPTRIITMGGRKTVNQEGSLRLNSSVSFHNVRLIPDAPYTIFSAAGIANSGCQTVVTDEYAIVLPKDTLSISEHISKAIMVFKRKGNLYTVDLREQEENAPKRVTFDLKEGTSSTSSSRPRMDTHSVPQSSNVVTTRSQRRTESQKTLTRVSGSHSEDLETKQLQEPQSRSDNSSSESNSDIDSDTDTY
jgi:hypothetical protein